MQNAMHRNATAATVRVLKNDQLLKMNCSKGAASIAAQRAIKPDDKMKKATHVRPHSMRGKSHPYDAYVIDKTSRK
jgi:hypothetical protein